jgi:hypothetical protein
VYNFLFIQTQQKVPGAHKQAANITNSCGGSRP